MDVLLMDVFWGRFTHMVLTNGKKYFKPHEDGNIIASVAT